MTMTNDTNADADADEDAIAQTPPNEEFEVEASPPWLTADAVFDRVLADVGTRIQAMQDADFERRVRDDATTADVADDVEAATESAVHAPMRIPYNDVGLEFLRAAFALELQAYTMTLASQRSAVHGYKAFTEYAHDAVRSDDPNVTTDREPARYTQVIAAPEVEVPPKSGQEQDNVFTDRVEVTVSFAHGTALDAADPDESERDVETATGVETAERVSHTFLVQI